MPQTDWRCFESITSSVSTSSVVAAAVVRSPPASVVAVAVVAAAAVAVEVYLTHYNGQEARC